MDTSITYRGVVSITTKKNKAIFHNKGSKKLFENFANFLTGGGYSLMSPPGYLMVYSYDGDDSSNVLNGTASSLRDVACLTSPINVQRDLTVGVGGVCKATFSATIYQSNLINNIYSVDSNYCVALLDSNREYVLAVSPIASSVISTLSGGGEVIIKWDMHLTNAEE